jgi:hypothetical protein
MIGQTISHYRIVERSSVAAEWALSAKLRTRGCIVCTLIAKKETR